MEDKVYYKYIHILGHNETKFSKMLLEYFGNPANGIDPAEHHFVTPYEGVYNALSAYENIELAAKYHINDGDYNGEIINEYAPQCQFLLIHRICRPLRLLKVKPEYFRKIAWRTWGGDVGYQYPASKPLSNAIKYVINHTVWKHIVKQFALVGIANEVDEIDLHNRFGTIPMLKMPYISNRNAFDIYSRIKTEAKTASKTVNVMLGHSGYSADNHIKLLEALSPYKDEDIRIFLPLSYGKEAYTQQVKEYAIRNWGEKVRILDEYMDYESYARLINQMDIGILDGVGSYALGNIALLRSFGKKLFLNRKGVIKKTFDAHNAPCCTTDQIPEMSFAEFVKPFSDAQANTTFLVIKPRAYHVENWQKIFQYLDDLNLENSDEA